MGINRVALEIVAYGSKRQLIQHIVTLPICLHIITPPEDEVYNFVVGHVHDVWNDFTPMPAVDLADRHEITGSIKIRKLHNAWLGAIFQFLEGQDYSEFDRLFVPFDLRPLRIEGYNQQFIIDEKPLNQQFSFKHDISSLIDSKYYGKVTFAGIGGDVKHPGVVDLEIEKLEF